MRATICTIGDEILIGQIIDTNSSHIARELNQAGIKVIEMISIPDEKERIIGDLSVSLANSDIVVVTGGLGPTKDDITKSALAELYRSRGYYEYKDQLELIKQMLSVRGIELSDMNKAQALIPDGAEALLNYKGTAPGMIFRFPEDRYPHKPVLYSIQGVPFEALGILPSVIEDIKRHFETDTILHRTLATFGIPESVLAKRLEAFENSLPEQVKLAYLPNPTLGVRLRLSVYDVIEENYSISSELIDNLSSILKGELGESIYGEGDDTLPIVIGRMLSNKKKTISTAESCTAGRIASLITSVPGSSGYFYGSVVAYDNSVKKDVLSVSEDIIDKYGAVSRECVESMALGVKNLMKTDYSIATSGIAGPDGGSSEKPVGLIWVGIAFDDPASGEEKVISESFIFNGDRERNCERFTSAALNMFRLRLV